MANEVTIGAKKYTPEQIEQAVKALERSREQAKKWREKSQTPEAKAKSKLASTRRRIEQTLLIAKAKKQGIVVTKEELDRAVAAASAAPAPAPKK